MAHEVFVSYSSKDKAVADAAVSALENHKIRCWCAPRDIRPGDDWGEAIANAITSSKVFLLIFSGNANRSQRVLDELNLAISSELTILPFRIEKLDPSGAMRLHLSTRHWLDAFVPSWDRHIEELVQTVASNLHMELAAREDKAAVPPTRRKKTLGWVLATLFVILLLTAGAVFGLPKILPAQESTDSAPNEAQTPTLSPTPEGTALGGSEENPIIWMYVPPAELDFSDVSVMAENIAAEFEAQNPGMVMKAIPATDKASITEALCDGEAQIGFLGAFTYLVAAERECGEVKLIWDAYSGLSYGGELVVRADSGITSIEELRGKTLCIPAYDSTSGWVLPSLEIRAAIGDPEAFFGEIIEVGAHPFVLDKVYNGECVAGTTYNDARESSSLPGVMNTLTVIFQTNPVPTTNVTFTEAIDGDLEQTLVEFFLAVSQESQDFARLNNFTISEDVTFRLIEINDYYNSIRDLLERAGASAEEFVTLER
jgi:phosphonate transport system substrate-binding protein